MSYALIGVLLGALVGIACWWLSGLAHSLTYHGPGIDPVLRHWVAGLGGAFGFIGLVFGPKMGNALGDAVSAIFHFEADDSPSGYIGGCFLLTYVALAVLVLWHSVPG